MKYTKGKPKVPLPLRCAATATVFFVTVGLYSGYFAGQSGRTRGAHGTSNTRDTILRDRRDIEAVHPVSGDAHNVSYNVLASPSQTGPGSQNKTPSGTTTVPANTSEGEPKELCTPPAYHEFPPDAFTNAQRAHGAVILHAIMATYMFVALAIVCDDYFVSSLDKICEKLGMSEDVAGATFMAAGSSAPELFTSIIGVFIAKGDVGVGTIVGSAVFNILFVIGLCAVLAGQTVPLSVWPILRDSFFYSLSVIALIATIADGHVSWYEAAIMLVLYCLYILLMRFNARVCAWTSSKIQKIEDRKDTSSILPPIAERKYYGNYEQFTNEDEEKKIGNAMGMKPTGQSAVIMIDQYLAKFPSTKLSFEDACFRFMIGKGFRPLTRFAAAARIIVAERKKASRDPSFPSRYQTIQGCTDEAEEIDESKLDGWLRLPQKDDGVLKIVQWVALVPLRALLFVSVPDCRKKRWDKWFMVTFVMSIVWIALFSYVMVWMVTFVGFTLGVPDSIMGITFLAAGTSIPDAMASVIVARQGQGDMAVSNTIGSNVFDILIGLALPWFIKTAIVDPGSTTHINSNGLVFSVVLLFLTVILTIGSIHAVGWRLDRRLGIFCLASYCVFLIFSIMIEFNVFGYVNAPMCREVNE